MSRSGYSDDCDDQWRHIMWRGAVASAMRGNRGQAFLRETAAALDAMPVKALIDTQLQAQDGAYCTLGAVGAARGMDMSVLDPDDIETVAGAFGISAAMAREIVYMNDEGFWCATPQERWVKMRAWVAEWIEAATRKKALKP